MGCFCSCCENMKDQLENSELCGVMSRPETAQNYLSTSIDSLPLLPPLRRPPRRGIPKPQQQSGTSNPSRTHSPVRSRQVPLSPKRLSPRRMSPSAAIPIHNPAEPGPSQASVAGSPQLRSPLSPIRYAKAQMIHAALLRQLEQSPHGVPFISPRMGTILEESTETETDSVVERPSSRSEIAGGGEDVSFPLFGAEASSDTSDED
ncbi:hypothetical protein HPB52_005485 [Rhipicephalus sanguineus]|uniref:Uncharacterized protein n=1 Tax=Rhipicephalus sanguineus TaxID=34632 RepID=A0A9D4PE70_RHISA|nr:hypothetical protein HPB52_005485 [Rhipicephalus sanguineus]